ncbi:MAG: AsmA-like C-terminal domain-containing protein [Epsilonproteobacteria bacterium]|nr:AsmA-like C-terminal domain-containing protein [Campylobacterota bacterium]
MSNFHFKKLAIKLNTRLHVTAAQLHVQPNKTTTSSSISLQKKAKYLYSAFKLFETLNIEHIFWNNYKGSLFYNMKDGGEFSLNNPHLQLQATFTNHNSYLAVAIKKLSLPQQKIFISGDGYIDLFSLNTHEKIDVTINNDANLTFFMRSTTNKIDYTLLSHNNIADPKYIISLFPLPDAANYWVYDAIKADSLTLESFTGTAKINNLADAYKSLHITAKLNNLTYTYHPKIEGVQTDYTALEFKDGVLYIRPHNGYSYGFATDKSWLKIDFSNLKKQVLTLFLDFTAKLNDDILHILKTYGINLPLYQKSGKTKCDLKLAVTFQTLNVNVQGKFTAKQGTFHYLGLDFDTKDLQVALNNYNLKINNMLISYKDILKTNATMQLDTKTSKGFIDFNITKLRPNDTLKLLNTPLHVRYNINPKHNTLKIKPTKWQQNGLFISLDAIDTPLDITKLMFSIPTTMFSVKNIANGYITGQVDLNKTHAQFNIDLLNFSYNKIKTDQSNTQIHLAYTPSDGLKISTDKDLYLNIMDTDVIVEELALTLFNNRIYTNAQPKIYLGNFMQGEMEFNYNLVSKRAYIDLYNLIIKNPSNKNTLYKKKKFSLEAYSNNNNTFYLSSKRDKLSFELTPQQWSLIFKDLHKLYKDSPLLQIYRINNGELKIYKNNTSKSIRFLGTINYPYQILMKNNKALTSYKVHGKIDTNKNVIVHIGHDVKAVINDTVNIKAKNIDISLPETIRLINDINKATVTKEEITPPTIKVTTLNSNIALGDARYTNSDITHIQYANKVLTAQLQHKSGKAGFKLEKNQFHIYGHNFSDTFMSSLFKFTKFKNGQLDFNIQGSLENFSGIILIKNTKMLNYTVINNVFAFVNTVPALLTFSVPQYSKNGLDVSNAYMKFDCNKSQYHISDLYVGSKELKILAKGVADTHKDSINMDMTLKTNIGSSASKIPLVGYILFDGQTVVTTLHITGKLTNPEVQSQIAKEVVVAPLNIIKRTLQLPLKIFKK